MSGHPTGEDAASALDAHVVKSDRYAILVLTGRVAPGSEGALRDALLESEHRDHGHVIADVRLVTEMSREAVKVLLWELGRAFEDRRTLRLVVRDVYQKRHLDGLGLSGMLPTHASLEEAMAAVDVLLSSPSGGKGPTPPGRPPGARARRTRPSAG
jgi:anti-anti-sigma regulatory factor